MQIFEDLQTHKVFLMIYELPFQWASLDLIQYTI